MDTSAGRLKDAARTVLAASAKGQDLDRFSAIWMSFKMRSHYLL
jgi:hypothetical protein